VRRRRGGGGPPEVAQRPPRCDARPMPARARRRPSPPSHPSHPQTHVDADDLAAHLAAAALDAGGGDAAVRAARAADWFAAAYAGAALDLPAMLAAAGVDEVGGEGRAEAATRGLRAGPGFRPTSSSPP